MATYTLIPSATEINFSEAWYEDADHAYHNTSWTQNYATYGIFAYEEDGGLDYVYLTGFDFSNIDTSLDYSVTVKVKAGADGQYQGEYGTVTLYSSETGVALSEETTLPVHNYEDADPAVTMLTLTATASTIMSYRSTLGLKFRAYDGPDADNVYIAVWGAEIILTEQEPEPVPNKIIYGNNVLLDLSTDTVTRADVVSGVTFHLPSGRRTTGTYDGAAPIKKTVEPTNQNSTTIYFYELTKEPSWFVVLCMAAGTTKNYRVYSIVYDGTKVSTQWDPSTGYGRVSSDWESEEPSNIYSFFTYSSGTLIIALKANSHKYFGNNVIYWLYYL